MGTSTVHSRPSRKDNDSERETIKVQKSVIAPYCYCLMGLVLDKNLTPRDAFLLLGAIITAGSFTCCEGILDFIPVTGTLPSVGSKPAVALDRV